MENSANLDAVGPVCLVDCNFCGKSYRVPPSRKRNRNFCTLTCFHKNNTEAFKVRTLSEAAPKIIVWDQAIMGSQSHIAKAWRGMHYRCSDNATVGREIYFLRGISVCREWHKYGAFLAWALENGQGRCLVVDRINTYEGYSPGNCRWVTQEVNSQNSRGNSFTAEKVILARRLREQGHVYREIAVMLGVSIAQAHVVCKYKGWKNV